MRRTTFAGLTELDPGEPLSTDNSSFQSRNPSITDHFLELGARTHRHDAHAALAAPTTAVTLAQTPTGGSLPGGVTLAITYTAVDSVGGETLAAPPASVTLPSTLAAPTSAPSTALDHTAGTLAPGTYHYCKTWVDAGGGETLAGPPTAADVPPGSTNSEIVVSGLNTGMVAAGATGWRLYKAVAGGDYHRLASGAGASFTDNGGTPADPTTRLPLVSTTSQRNKATVTLPVAGALPTGTVTLRVYGSLSAGYPDPALVATHPVADAGTSFDITSWSPSAGRPPAVATAVGGATKIDPATELLDFHWQRPVANAAALPSVGNTHGDVRATLDDNALHIWGLDDAWHSVAGGGGGALPAWTTLPYATNFVDDTSGPYGGGKYSKDAPEIVRLRGAVTRTTTASFDGDIFATLPVGFRPPTGGAVSKIVPFWDSSAAAWVRATVTILDTGEMYIENTGVGVGTLDTIVLSDFTFRTT